jgi:S-adenosylmethionine:tRNA ribosyltransferase-isomerase
VLTSDFDFDLPAELIAKFPSPMRGEDRLMVLERANGRISHKLMADLPTLVPAGAVAVFNNSRVRKARLIAKALDGDATGEFLLIKQLDARSWSVLVKHSKRRHPGTRYSFGDVDGVTAELGSAVSGADEFERVLCFSQPIDDAWLETHGHIPLPPYLKRGDVDSDSERYQTVYAREVGSAAAPTAGLHFTDDMLERLRLAGVETAFLTLHVGLGTFLPVRSATVEEHTMHRERYSVSDDVATRIEQAKIAGRPVLAVGTTSVRTLESAWRDGTLQRGEDSTNIFIYGDYRFKVVDMLFTNFHTPESTLLMLVAAFCGQGVGAEAGRVMILDAYREAVRERYRFFSYGDAMLII